MSVQERSETKKGAKVEPQMGPKWLPKRMQNRSKNMMIFLIDFEAVLEPPTPGPPRTTERAGAVCVENLKRFLEAGDALVIFGLVLRRLRRASLLEEALRTLLALLVEILNLRLKILRVGFALLGADLRGGPRPILNQRLKSLHAPLAEILNPRLKIHLALLVDLRGGPRPVRIQRP